MNDSKEWIIKFYNPVVEKEPSLDGAWKVVNSLESLVEISREGDRIEFQSAFSLYGLDSEKLIDIINQRGLKCYFKKENKPEEKQVFNNFTIQTVSCLMDFIKNEKENIKRIL